MKLTKRNKRILKKMGLPQTKKVYENLTEKQIYKYNTYRQKEVGKKKYDYMEITEPGKFNRSIFKYENLKEWDQRNHNYQQKHMRKNSKSLRKLQKEKGRELSELYEKRPYENLHMTGDWFRMMPKPKTGKRKLVYGMIEGSNSYIYIKVLDMLQEAIDKKYPSIMVDLLKEKEEGTGLIKVEFETRAAGNEKKLKEVEKDFRGMYRMIEEDILQRVSPYAMYTFKEEDEDKVNGLDMYIVGGIEAAENISFKTFLEDFDSWVQPIGVLENIVEEVYEKYKNRLFL